MSSLFPDSDLGTRLEPLAVGRELQGLLVEDAGRIVPAVSEAALDGLKFSECLPVDLASEVVRARLADERGVAEVLGRPTRNVSEV